MPTSITATPEKIRFEKDGFCIMLCSCKENHLELDNGRSFSIKGYVIGEASSILNQEVTFTGELEKNQYGFTLSFSNYSVNESDDYFWLNISGASKKAVKSIIKKYGKNPDWLDKGDAKSKLMTISGIKDKTSNKILARWTDYQGIRLLVEQLAPYNVSQKQVSAIYRHFGDRSIAVLSENPYKLTEIRGVGFLKADEIARKLGVDERSYLRMSAGIVFIMQQLSLNGHTMGQFKAIYKEVNENIPMSDGSLAFPEPQLLMDFLYEMSMSEDNDSLRVVSLDDKGKWYGLSNMVYMENYIFDKFVSFLDEKNTDNKAATLSPPRVILHLSKLNNEMSFKLGEQQKKALLLAASTPYAVAIAGYAGTGKSTVSKVLLNMLEENSKLKSNDIVCCALSGVAANRIKQQSGYESYTIHSLLGFEGGKFVYNENNKLPFSVIVLDEGGMVDSWLFFSLLKSIDFNKTKLIILGDPAQLPPVSPGQPFLDLLNCNLIKFTELTQIFRQSADKAIPLIAQSIRIGEQPLIAESYSDVGYCGLFSDRNSDRLIINQQIEERIVNLSYENRWQKGLPSCDSEYWDYITDFQVITPRKTGQLGAEGLNKAVRLRMLPSNTSPVVFKNLTPMTHFDKVIHLKNTNMSINGGDKKARVFNGQIGVVTHVDTEEQTITVRYPLNKYSVTYEEKHLRDGLFGLAWALTIHKTQGAEFNHVVIPLTMSHYIMLNNKLFYTAVTRAKSRLDLIGEHRALQYASTNKETIQRNTVLNLISS